MTKRPNKHRFRPMSLPVSVHWSRMTVNKHDKSNVNNNTDIPLPPTDSTEPATASPAGQHLGDTDIPSTPTIRCLNSTCACPTFVNKAVVPEPAVSVVDDHGIVNLSNYALSPFGKQLLSKGLSFFPSPDECYLSNAKFAIDKLHHSLCLAHVFHWKWCFPWV